MSLERTLKPFWYCAEFWVWSWWRPALCCSRHVTHLVSARQINNCDLAVFALSSTAAIFVCVDNKEFPSGQIIGPVCAHTRSVAAVHLLHFTAELSVSDFSFVDGGGDTGDLDLVLVRFKL